MLPFFKPKAKDSGVATTYRVPDSGEKAPESMDMEGIKACAADLIRAIHAKDEDAVAEAIKSAFEILDAAPHEEGEHTNEE